MKNTNFTSFLLEFESALKLSREKGVGASEFKKLIDRFNTPSSALDYWNNFGKYYKKTNQNKSTTIDKIHNAIEKIRSNSLTGTYYKEAKYPNQLLSLTEPPPVLFATSEIKDHKYVAIVGSRKMTQEAAYFANKYAKKYIDKGYAIISGGALGVDGEAHKTALDLNAYTVAVLGCGVDINYPKANSDLLNSIRKKGNIISELMPDTPPAKGFFPTRNRIIAAMSDIVIIIQASEKSGSLITANWAKKLGKQIITVHPPANCDIKLWEGSIKLLQNSV